MKKVFAWIILIGILVSFLVSVGIVIAEEGGTTVGEVLFGGLFEKLSKLLEKIFGKDKEFAISSTKLLLGALLWMVLYTVFKQGGIFKGERVIFSGIAALIVTILFFMYLPDGFALGLAFPYVAAGATILNFIPFFIIIYFTLFVTEEHTIALAIWVVYLIYYWGILLYVIFSETIPEALPEGGAIKFVLDKYGISILIAIASLVVVIFFSKIKFKIENWKIVSAETQAKTNVKKAGSGVRILKDVPGEFAGGGGI